MNDARLLDAYLSACWTVDAPGGSLRVEPGSPAPAALRPAGIVTAWNPASLPHSLEENRRADAELGACLAAQGLSAWRTQSQGADLDPAWEEPGWCLAGADRDVVVRMGARYGQNAVLWIDASGAVSVVCSRQGFCGAAPGDRLG